MNILLIILGMAIITFSIRYGLLAFSGRFQLSDRLEQALRYVPPAVLTTIVVPGILMPEGNELQINFNNAYLVGGVIAFAVGLYKKNLLLTITVGFIAFFGWQWMLRI